MILFSARAKKKELKLQTTVTRNEVAGGQELKVTTTLPYVGPGSLGCRMT